MPEEWNNNIICPIHIHHMPYLNFAYKILTTIVTERLKPHVLRIVGPYQCGFMPGKSTSDQLFTP